MMILLQEIMKLLLNLFYRIVISHSMTIDKQ